MGGIVYKSPRDLERMRAAGKIVSIVLAALRDAVRPGVTTLDLDRITERMVRQHGGYPSFLNYRGYPASLCASINEEVVHGIPSADRVLRDGDIVKLDVGVRLHGFHADSALTVPVGTVESEILRLIEVTRQSLWEGIRAVRPRGRMYDVSGAIQRCAEDAGYSVVRELVGHGVGRRLHEEPQIPNFVDAEHPNLLLREGMTLAIEPMVNQGVADVEVLDDRWTVVTKDRRMSAHFEHTVAVVRGGHYVLTLGPHDSGE